jgi:hypothetical protein
MPTTLITLEDLQEFKHELLEELKAILLKSNSERNKRYIKSAELMKLLQISPGTLQNLRINNTLPYTKIGGIIYYDMEEIHGLMTKYRVDHKD